MKNIFYSICFIAVSFVFMACPYKSSVPLAEKPSEAVQDKFLGEYEKKNSSTYSYTVAKESAKMYKITETANSSKKEYFYYGYTTTIDGNTFLQTFKKPTSSTSKKSYYIYRLKPAKSGAFVTLEPLTKNIREKFTSSSEFRRFVKNNQDLSFFFEKDEKYYKSE